LALLSESATANPPGPAALFNVTMQLDEPGAFTLAGIHVTPLSITGTTRLIVAVLLCPPQLAVTVAV
jgi:hypothetical protein